ncbi:MAG: murein L,D-transpeptidase catalytic domain family protein [Candidatus Riflebacteria bacterium]|nr:murein L,D-transpeptidase catalytic domain family protein [Candidatus Riflebacteria bacterium]
MKNWAWKPTCVFSLSILIVAFIGLLTMGTTTPAFADSEQSITSLPDDPTHEGDEPVPPLTKDEAAHLAQFQEPNLTPQEAGEIVASYAFVDPNHAIPKALREKAIVYFDFNKDLIGNKDCLSVVDYSIASRIPRFHIINMKTGEVVSVRVAHGEGSDPQDTGFASLFSNVPDSKTSSLGFYLTAEEYNGKHGQSCRLDGLSSTNSNVRQRGIVIHGANYVEDADVKPGRSWGCLAVSMENHSRIVTALKDGSIILGTLH